MKLNLKFWDRLLLAFLFISISLLILSSFLYCLALELIKYEMTKDLPPLENHFVYGLENNHSLSTGYDLKINKSLWLDILDEINGDYISNLSELNLYYGYFEGTYHPYKDVIDVVCKEKEECEAVFYHEIAHHIWYKILNNTIREEWCQRWTSDLLTLYSTDKEEYFAEAFAIYSKKYDIERFKKEGRILRNLTEEETKSLKYIEENIKLINSQPIN